MLKRRALVGRGALVGGLVVSATACDAFSTEPANQRRAAGRGSKSSKESPQLARQVKNGDLPPLEERLPNNPVVVQPTKSSGNYGGTWKTALDGSADTSWLRRTIGYEDLTRWNHPWTDTIPNVAESVKSTSNNREFIITIRKGMQWSDGHPFTSDDIIFAWNDVLRNEKLTPVMPLFMLSEEKPADIEQVDERVVRFTFDKPKGLFSSYLAYACTTLVQSPKHYLKQFHPRYSKSVDDDARKAGFGDWVELFMARADIWANGDLPRFHPWILTTALGESNRVVAERNPYYFKTDPNGRQLPYLDKVVYDVTSNEEVILLKASHGDIDFSTRHINTPENKPVLARARKKSGFDFMTVEPAFDNEMVIALNLAHKDPVKRKVFQNKEFRIGLSHAINREELIDATYRASGEPWQAAPRKDSEYFDERLAKQYTEFDPEKAEQHLDQAGLTGRDGNGFRLGPDGKRITIAVEVAQGYRTFWQDAMQLVNKRWKKVGIDSRMKSEDRSLFYERKKANNHDAGLWSDAGGLTKDIVLDPRWYFPYSDESVWATPWAAWFASRGDQGEKPPVAPLQQMKLYWQMLITGDEKERRRIFKEILDIARDQFYVIGTVKADEYYGIVKNDFKNVPNSMPGSHIYNTPAPSKPRTIL